MRRVLAWALVGLLAGGCRETDAPAADADTDADTHTDAEAALDDSEPTEEAGASAAEPDAAEPARDAAPLDGALHAASDASQRESDAAKAIDAGVRPGSYSLNFADATLENPLSAGPRVSSGLAPRTENSAYGA